MVDLSQRAGRGEISARGSRARTASIHGFVSSLLGLCWLIFGSGTAQAHPHVWITAHSDLVYAADGTVTGVRHAWSFDDMFSTYALQGIETKTKDVYTREDLAPLAQTNVESLKEFGFFTFAKADGRKQRFLAPVDYYLVFDNNVLTLHFTLPLKVPVKSKELAVEVFDPTYFIDFSFEQKDPVKLVGAPTGCALSFQRPNDGTADATRLGEQNFMNGDNSNYGAMFANKIIVSCP
ncbi:DUF1007 family protein [Rhodopseudomonas palustris]|uniref:ABC transporter substrate-binding protein n=1 Tax=Rhodopseudomonas palustris (strain BisB18) TaxID=316056 RepID=Q20WX4_RHOPB